MAVIEDLTPLKQNHLPEEFTDREQEQKQLKNNLELRNIHIHGPRGTGKTHVIKKILKEVGLKTCYVSCLEHNTQYKALRQIITQLSGRSTETGHHTAELQRKVEENVAVMDTVIILDELDFLLLNDGEDLLYFLSRLDNQPKIALVTTQTDKLREKLEPRTYSSLQPFRIQFEPYTGEQIYEILADRASRGLKNRTVHRNAVTYIASSTQNAEKALTWFRVAARNTQDTVTEELIQNIQKEALEVYIENKLRYLSKHHRYLFQAVKELSQEKGPVINTGDIYPRYETIAAERSENALSNRRISDYLKQLEKLDLITADYHYGGKKGKTREVRLEEL